VFQLKLNDHGRNEQFRMNGTAFSLKHALKIAEGTLQAARAAGYAPSCVAVLDQGGHVLALLRDERASLFRPQIAIAKASGCLGMGFGGRELARRAQAMPQFFTSLSAIFPDGMIPVAGGVLVRGSEKQLYGAVGVSGDTSENDELCAVSGIEGAGFVADTGAAAPEGR
jgi:uncharacterized protein GlcG (DUF336 family)